MIPIRDLNPTRRKPFVTWTLIAINALVWIVQLVHGAESFALTKLWGVTPNSLTHPQDLQVLLTPLTSMFMHGGWMHVIGNMWFLYIFGDNVEDELGRGRFLAFYILSGLAAVIAQVVIDPSSTIPMVGASGAIAGVLGGYILLHPRTRVLAVLPIFIFIQLIELPAWVFLIVWFGLQLLHAFTSIGEVGGGVAFFAHVGGFVAGLALVKLFLPRKSPSKTRRGAWQPELRRARRR